MPPVERQTTQRAKVAFPQRELRRALWLIIIAWVFGAAFFAITGGAALTAFLTKFLKTDDVSYGLILAAGQAAVVVQFFASYLIERTGRIKRNFLIYVTAHRLLWFGVTAVALLSPATPQRVKILLVGLCCFLSAALSFFGGVGWTTWMSDIVPKSLAGKFFGYRARIGMIVMAVTAVGVSYLLDKTTGEGWVYALIFGVAAVCGMADILCFIPIREVPRPVEPQPPTLVEIITTPWKNATFRSYLFYTCAAWFAYMLMAPFTWRFCFDPLREHGLGMSISQTNLLLVILPLVAMAWVAPFWGEAIDRFGPKPVLAASSIAAIIIPASWVFMRPGLEWLLVLVVIVNGLCWPGIDQVQVYMQLKGFPNTRRSAYNAMFVTAFGLACMAGTALGGKLADLWKFAMPELPDVPAWVSHYHPVFLTSILLRLVVFLLLFRRMDMPGAARARTVARSLAGSLSASIPGRKKGSKSPAK